MGSKGWKYFPIINNFVLLKQLRVFWRRFPNRCLQEVQKVRAKKRTRVTFDFFLHSHSVSRSNQNNFVPSRLRVFVFQNLRTITPWRLRVSPPLHEIILTPHHSFSTDLNTPPHWPSPCLKINDPQIFLIALLLHRHAQLLFYCWAIPPLW